MLKQKLSFGATDKQHVKVITDSGQHFTYNGNTWTPGHLDIHIFDTHFIEDNIYIGSSLSTFNQMNLFDIVVGKEGVRLKEKLAELYGRKQHALKTRKNLKRTVRASLRSHETGETGDYTDRLRTLSGDIQAYGREILTLNKELGIYASKVFGQHIESINRHLRLFAPHIQLQKFSNRKHRFRQLVTYSLSVGGEKVKFTPEGTKGSRSIKYTLSEGDKSAFAISFFLAKLEETKLDGAILVFDDPISSFDQSRRNATLNQLLVLANQVEQLFLMTHDMNFAKLATARFHGSQAASLVVDKRPVSRIRSHDIESEMQQGVFKDIHVLRRYLSHGASTDSERRDVMRCIRPILEGVIRMKFFLDIERNEWLGDMLSKIRKSSIGDRLFRLQPYQTELGELNDYSKSYHHSDPTNPSCEIINAEELWRYVERTLQIIQLI